MGHVASKKRNGAASVKDQRSAAREKVKAMQEAQRRKDRRTRALIISAGVVVAAILVTVGVFAITGAREESAAQEAALSEVVVPAGVTDDGGIVATGPDDAGDAPVTVTEYLDYQCPACQQFDLTVGPYLKDQVDQGTVELEYHPVNFLDSMSSGTRYSSRAGNAAYCTVTNGGDIVAFSDTLYAQQPPEGGQGLPDEDLVSAARDAGASEAVEQCIADETHTGFVAQQNEQAFASEADGGVGIEGTPAVFVNGELVENTSLAGVQAAVEAAQQ